MNEQNAGGKAKSDCACRSHPVWLALDAIVWLVLDRSILVRRRCPIHSPGAVKELPKEET
jgi:hypothetical protein